MAVNFTCSYCRPMGSTISANWPCWRNSTGFFPPRALTDVTLLSITREAFHKVMEKYPEQLPKTVSRIVNGQIERFIDQTHYLLDHLKEEAWRECGLEK